MAFRSSRPPAQDPARIVPSATNLPAPAKDDQDRRMRNYLLSMGIRTVCFLAAVLTWHWAMWLSIVLFVGAAVLPYIAVVMANAVGQRRIDVLGSVAPTPSDAKQIHGSSSER